MQSSAKEVIPSSFPDYINIPCTCVCNIPFRICLPAGAVADMLSLSRQHVYTMAASGELPSIKFRGAVRFDPKEVERFIQAHRRKEA